MYYPKIGLEIHIEVKTNTKMFCCCKNEPDEKQPNKNVCPICLGYPGTLPLLNEEAIKKVIKLGLILGGSIEKYTYFERKHYFYPDLPKGYQISQYQKPIVKKAELKLANNKIIRIKRVHIEEDTGKLYHKESYSLVDFNRAGIPLIELVTKPDIENSKEAYEFAKKLREILVFNDISDASMEKGHMRLEANISVSKEKGKLGTKVEVKNLNSFKSLKDAIDYEIKRHSEMLDKNAKLIQETRGWNENTKKTISQRLKEKSEDYRYFKEPDIPPLHLTQNYIDKIKSQLPESFEIYKTKLKEKYHLNPETINAIYSKKSLINIVQNIEDSAKKTYPDESSEIIKTAFNLFTTTVLSLIKVLPIEKSNFNIKEFLRICELYFNKKINNLITKGLIKENYLEGSNIDLLLKKYNIDLNDQKNTIDSIVLQVIKENEKAVNDFLNGNERILQFLIGQCMKLAKGNANPEELQKILLEVLKNAKLR